MAESKYYGIYQGIVTNIDDPEKRGRIKCIIPTVLGEDAESAWCDPISIVAYDNGGDFCLPFVEEAVWILFLEGNANQPVYLGGWWQKEQSPCVPYDKLDDTRIINYKDFRITLHETTATIEVEKSQDKIVMNDKGIDITDKTGNRIKMHAGGIDITSPVHIGLKAPKIDLN